MNFIEVAMANLVDRNWTYYIGGSNYRSSFPSDVQVTPYSYCPDPNNANGPGKIIQIINVKCAICLLGLFVNKLRVTLVFILFLEHFQVAITNINEGRIPQYQALPPAQNETMGTLCEIG